MKSSVAYKYDIEVVSSNHETANVMYSKGEVQRAGETLIIPDVSNSDPDRYFQAMKVLSYWRACHIYPLDNLAHILQSDVLKIDKKAIIAKRLKRTPSIIAKLTRFDSMKLRNMQDIGGCRVIVGTIKQVQKLKRELNKNRHFKVTDYIEKPKGDGYRGIHLVGKFPGEDRQSNYSIEVQLRSLIQHSWATAVEIIDLFTNQALKADQGKQDWKDFFRTTSIELAKLESSKSIPEEGTLEEVHRLTNKLNVIEKFGIYSSSLRILNEFETKDVDGYFLLSIDTKNSTLTVDFYDINAYDEATKNYLKAEKAAVKKTWLVVALVSSSSVKALREAYPNYFADSYIFVSHLTLVLAKYRETNPSLIAKMFSLFQEGRKS